MSHLVFFRHLLISVAHESLNMIRERGALSDILVGNIAAAIDKVSNICASLPGAGYGKHEHRLEDLLARYQAAGGILAPSV
ncbi:hypothetical protein [Pseudomonas sp. RC10]|uniref:hypothetical protein n=1 Tax=Pseudomonas bambusae TaxID=3139142 RepID=UPI0031386C13